MIALALPSLVPASCIPLTFFYHTMNVIVDFLEDLLPDFICDFVRVMLNSLVFNWLVFFALFLVVLLVGRSMYHDFSGLFFPSQHEDESQTMIPHQSEDVMSPFIIASFQFGLVLCALTDWIGLDVVDSEMIGVGRTYMVLLVCCLTLTAYVQFIAFHLVFCRDCFYGYFGNHSVNPNAAMITSDVDMVVEGDNDDYYGNHEDIQEDMDWEPSTNVTFYTTNVDRESKMKSKCRIAHIVRRTSPLYWRHPLLAMEEYSYAASIRSPGRSFIQAGRAFPPIHEGVHFFSGLVSQVHVIPRDGPHEIARGRRFVTSDIDSPP